MALDVLPLRVAVLSSSGTIIEVNGRWSEFAAGTTDPVASQTTGEQYLAGIEGADAEATQKVATSIQSLLEGQTDVISVPCRIEHSNGATWNLFRAAAFETSGERYVGIACVDISDQRQSFPDHQLKERAMDEAPVGITLSDPTTEDNELIYVNNAFERITGYETESAVGQNCRFLQGEETSEESVAKMRNAIENRESTVVEVLNYPKSGEKFCNEVTITSLHDDSGGLTHVVGCQRDISKRKRAEQELNVERDQLALLNQLVRRDIRNDMAVILGWGDHRYDRANEQHQEDVLRILTSARHSKQLTESVRGLLALLREDDPEGSVFCVDRRRV
jgi:PAS domain S-box-containing protein